MVSHSQLKKTLVHKAIDFFTAQSANSYFSLHTFPINTLGELRISSKRVCSRISSAIF